MAKEYKPYKGSITDVEGIEVGHAVNIEGGTGCTVIITRAGAVGGVDVRGRAPGTRETDLLKPGMLVEKCHAIVLSGGSAFGLSSADGVMKWLRNENIGFDAGVGVVPIVPAAVLFDLGYKKSDVWPDSDMGMEACVNAVDGDIEQGSVGAGTGATVGKMLGAKAVSKSGIGTACIKLSGGVKVAAMVAVNAFGDVIDHRTGNIIAGPRLPVGGFLNTAKALLKASLLANMAGKNTTIGVIATNAQLTVAQANFVASIAHDGYAKSISPVHTMMDGDAIFALSTGDKKMDVNLIGVAAVEVMSRAITNAVYYAER